MWGKINRLCFDFMEEGKLLHHEKAAIFLLQLRKKIKYNEDENHINTRQAVAFTHYGYSGQSPADCDCALEDCYVDPQRKSVLSSRFDFYWEPGLSKRGWYPGMPKKSP